MTDIEIIKRECDILNLIEVIETNLTEGKTSVKYEDPKTPLLYLVNFYEMWDILKRKLYDSIQRNFDQERLIIELKYEVEKLKNVNKFV